MATAENATEDATEEGFSDLDTRAIFRESKPEARRQAAVRALSRKVNDCKSMAEVLGSVSLCLTAALRFDHYAFYDASTSELVSCAVGELKRKQAMPCTPQSIEHSAFEVTPAGFALRDQQVVTFADLVEDDQFQDAQLAESRIATGLVAPVPAKISAAFGALNVKRCEISEEDVDFSLTLASLVAPALSQFRAAKLLEQQQQFISRAFDSMQSLVLLLDDQGHILQINRTGTQLTGYSERDVVGRTIYGALLIPEDCERMNDALEQVWTQDDPVELDTFVLDHRADRRQFSWTLVGVHASGQRNTVFASAIDRSKEFELLRQTDIRTQADTATREQPRQKTNSERRLELRRAYPTLQCIAPYDGQSIPELNRFQEVRCRDISSHGFSFFFDENPKFKQLVVVFGGGSSRILLIAEVRHISEFQRHGRTEYLVGCRYLGRANF